MPNLHLLRRLVGFIRRRRFDDDLREELEFHADMKRQALEESGASPTSPTSGLLRVREQSRDVWMSPGLAAFEALVQDLRHAVRLLRRNPGFTVTALCTLALGIGLNTAIFSIVYGVLLKPLGYREPSRLVAVVPGHWFPFDYHQLASHNQTFDGLAAFTGSSAHLTGLGEPQQLWGLDVTPNFLDVLGLNLALGRGFVHHGNADATTNDDAGSVIISDHLWRAAFNGDANVLGRTITLDGHAKTIIGVLQPDFAFRLATQHDLDGTDLIALNVQPDQERHNAFLTVIGRLRPEATREQAEADLQATSRWIEQQFPDKRIAGRTLQVVDLQSQVVGTDAPRLLWVLAGAVLLVLLIVCVNIANLQLARWSSRRTELSVRMALGAGRARLVRQLVSESLVLAIAGGALGAAVAYVAMPLLLANVPEFPLPRMGDIQVSLPVLVFSLVLSIATGLLFGLLPALRQSSHAQADGLRGGGGSGAGRTTSSRENERLRSGLVIAQIALTLVLLVSAGLLMHSFMRLLQVRPGFATDDVVTVSVVLGEEIYKAPPPMKAFAGGVLDRLRDMPGASGTSIVTMIPFGMFAIRGDFQVEGEPTPRFYILKPETGPGYFKTLGIPMLSGREFQDTDTADAPKVAIVSESVANRLWPASEPGLTPATPAGRAIGKRVRVNDRDWLTVVGVASDVRQAGLHAPLEPAIYTPYQQETKAVFLQVVTFVARTRTPDAAASYIRQAIHEVAPDLPITQVATMKALVAESVAEPRMRTMLLGSFALSALLIAMLGIYGVMTYAVTQRRREIGIRMAIGAEWTDVVWLVLRRAILIVGAGAAIGIAASVAVTRTLTSFLFEVTPTDPVAIGGVTVLLVLVGLTAAWLPARRAAQTDPVEALRVE